jgi:hypothetical protein
MYKYKIKEQKKTVEDFQEDRISTFSKLEDRLTLLKKLIRLAKIDTIKYYRENPDSYAVVIGTDLIDDYFNDIETLLQQNEDETYT